MRLRIGAVLLLALVVAAPALANERHPTLGELEHEVMCPTCKTLLELSHAPVADRMRAFIRKRIAAGDSKSRIEAELVAEFGEGVLAAPPRRGFGLIAWVLPFAGLFGAGAVVATVAYRWKSEGDAEAALAETAASGRTRLEAELDRRLDRELARFDD